MYIGVDTRLGLIYEGDGTYGHPVHPAPLISPATVGFASEGQLDPSVDTQNWCNTWIFREDSFDPIARIRRGRFYSSSGISQRTQWRVSPHPAIASEMRELGNDARVVKELNSFQSRSFMHSFPKAQRELPMVLLGQEGRYTIWKAIHVEVIITGEEVVTLKGRQSLGILPGVKKDAIPEPYRKQVDAALDAFVDEAHRASPVSVIDRARDAASWMLMAYLVLPKEAARDLGELIKKLVAKDEKKVIAASAAQIIARLHARAKPVEQHKRDLRPVQEQDAELAMQCIGTLLCELGLGEWA